MGENCPHCADSDEPGAASGNGDDDALGVPWCECNGRAVVDADAHVEPPETRATERQPRGRTRAERSTVLPDSGICDHSLKIGWGGFYRPVKYASVWDS